ncbi:MAG: trypsin-like peptidase domain-containing protein [Opitutales bacterium]
MRQSTIPSILLRRLALVVLSLIASAAFASGVSRGFNRLLDAVVRIDVSEMTLEEGTQSINRGIGSGVIISKDGLILTNAHVASPQAVKIAVTLSNLERVNARLVGWDHWTDLAVLRLDLDEVHRRGLSFANAEFGDSDKLYPGETVYAVGTPYGLSRTVTRGIISNNNRPFSDPNGLDGYETGFFNNWLQTDAAINPGNSGGPLVTEDGDVIGINSRAYIGAEGLGFAIPANVARRVADALVHHGIVTRSYLGIRLRQLQDHEKSYDLAMNTGVLVDQVDTGSPAARAGLRPNDVLLSVNGQKLDGRFEEQLAPILNTIASLPVGSPVQLGVKRGGQNFELGAVTEKLESQMGEEAAFEKWGLSVRKVSRTYARNNQLADATGVLVIGVLPGYPAAQSGVEQGDILTKVAGTAVSSLGNLRDLYHAYEQKPGPVLVEAQRNRRISLYVFKP